MGEKGGVDYVYLPRGGGGFFGTAVEVSMQTYKTEVCSFELRHAEKGG